MNMRGIDRDGKTCLILAIESLKNEKIFKRLVGMEEIDVNKADKYGKTPLFYALERGYRGGAPAFVKYCMHAFILKIHENV